MRFELINPGRWILWAGAVAAFWGDSLMDGVGAEVQGGCRGPILAAFPDMVTVGSFDGPAGRHDGHPSFTSADTPTGLLGIIGACWAARPAQLMFLHIGTNDYQLGASPAESAALSAANVAALVDYVHGQTPATIIMLALIINPRSDYVSLIPFINLQRPAVAAAVRGRPWVYTVEMDHVPDSEFFVGPDRVHPTPAGYTNRMAAPFIAAVRNQ